MYVGECTDMDPPHEGAWRSDDERGGIHETNGELWVGGPPRRVEGGHGHGKRVQTTTSEIVENTGRDGKPHPPHPLPPSTN